MKIATQLRCGLQICRKLRLLFKIYFQLLIRILDYYLKRENELLIVEAKNADLTRAFTQLAVDMASETHKNIIYGAVSTGQEWRFGRLNRAEKKFYQDINTYTVPSNLERIVRILIGILEVK